MRRIVYEGRIRERGQVQLLPPRPFCVIKMCMERTLISETPQHIGTMVLLKGWLVSIRDHGGVSFFTMRDATGIVQVVVTKALRAQYPLLSEWSTVALTGQITERPEKLRNPAMPTGSIEVQAQAIEVLSVAQPLPLPIDSEGYEITEDLRLRYRYLDLRRERIQRNLKTRQQMQDIVRESLRAQRFYEIDARGRAGLCGAQSFAARDILRITPKSPAV